MNASSRREPASSASSRPASRLLILFFSSIAAEAVRQKERLVHLRQSLGDCLEPGHVEVDLVDLRDLENETGGIHSMPRRDLLDVRHVARMEFGEAADDVEGGPARTGDERAHAHLTEPEELVEIDVERV